MRPAALVLALISTTACSHRNSSDFQKFSGEAVFRILAFSPVNASGQGLHKYNGEDLDRELDNLTFQSVRRQRDYYADLHKRLEAFEKNALAPEDRADYDMLEYQIGLALFDIDIAQSWRRAPQGYVELLGNALFNPFVLEYAPKEERFRHIIARLEKIPAFCDTARRQLSEVPEIWSTVAQQENEGNIDLIDHTLRSGVPADLKADFDKAAGPALDALRLFSRFLTTDLPQRRGQGGDWRLGPDRYAIKFKFALATDSTPDQVLSDAEARLKQVRARMLELSAPLHAQLFPKHGQHDDLRTADRENTIIKEVLDRIAQNHSTPAGYFDDAKKDLEEARRFVKAKNLLTLPAGENLQVIPTPVFERGIYGVGGFNPAPVLEPNLGAFFWITPIPADWPKERVESKLREYNVYNLHLLVIHEAMPGHYVQGDFANRIQPKERRVLRAMFGNGPYVEGWAQYITQVMLDQGFLGNSPELRLQLLKQELRVDANAILDIRLQTNRMTDEEAMNLMENSTFQEHEEAVAKLQRAKLSSAQLPTYFVGWRDWLRLRDRVKGDLHDFHDRALKEGAVPMPVLSRLLK